MSTGHAKPFQLLSGNDLISHRHKKARIIAINAVEPAFCIGTKRHKQSDATFDGRSGIYELNHIALSFSLLTKKGLSVSVQRHAAGGVTKQLLHHLCVSAVQFQ